MSFEFNADEILTTLWDTLRPERPAFGYERHPEGGITETGLMVTLDLRVFHISHGCDEYRRSALVHTLFTANTAVFQAHSSGYDRWNQVALGDFHNYSNHDSCWRTDGMRGFQHLYMEMTAAMNEEIVEHGFSALAPREFSQFCTLGSLGSKPWEFVTVSHRKIPTEYHRRELLSLERLSTGDQV